MENLVNNTKKYTVSYKMMSQGLYLTTEYCIC